MENQLVSAILISSRRQVREAVRQQLAQRDDVRLDAELTHPFSVADAGYLEDIRLLQPGVVLLDLEPDRAAALELAQLLAERGAGRLFGVADAVSPELLLQAMRAGITEYFTLPVEPAAFHEALDRAARKGVLPGVRPAGGQVLTFFSTKGGSGATMVASNTAVALRRAGSRRVVVVDLDLEMGDVALFLGLKPKYNILDLSRNLHRMDENLLVSFLVEHSSGVHLLPAPANPERSETLSPEQIRQIFNLLKQKYDVVVVDTSNAFYDYTLSAFDQADRICLVANVDLPSLRNTQRTFHMLDRLGYARESIKLIVNRYQPKGPIKLPAVEQTLSFPVFHVLSNDYNSVIQAINTGEPLGGDSPAPIARELAALAEALARDAGLVRTPELSPPTTNGPTRTRGLGRLLARLTKDGDEEARVERAAAPAARSEVSAHAS